MHVLLTGKSRSSDDDDDDDENGVVVREEDFYSALSHLVPSLSAADMKRYDRLQEMFTHHRHSNPPAAAASSSEQ